MSDLKVIVDKKDVVLTPVVAKTEKGEKGDRGESGLRGPSGADVSVATFRTSSNWREERGRGLILLSTTKHI